MSFNAITLWNNDNPIFHSFLRLAHAERVNILTIFKMHPLFAPPPATAAIGLFLFCFAEGA